MRIWGGAFIAALASLSFVPSLQAVPYSTLPAPALSSRAKPIVPVVVFGEDARRGAQAFAQEHNLVAADVIHNQAASGLISCGNAHGAGQLTLTDDVVTTAAHVFFDENGVPRARFCSFDLTVDGTDLHVPIDLGSIVAGSTKPYDVEVTHDWAVARLTHAVTGVKPYGIATDIHPNEAITFVARGHIDWGGAKALSMQDCLLHDKLSDGVEGTREFSFDCDTGDGASGGAVMVDRGHSRIGAILVGWRSNRPFKAMPFSTTHYNFAVTMEGAFREAVYSAAGKVMVQK